jgi:putative endonuclease
MSNNSMTLYVGVTNDLSRRVHEHKTGESSKFTSRYHFDRCVYYEFFDLITEAIEREKQIKGWTRAKKIALIKTMNPEWRDVVAGFS